jgi:hypothetical protein
MPVGCSRRLIETPSGISYDVCVLTGDDRGATYGPLDAAPAIIVHRTLRRQILIGRLEPGDAAMLRHADVDELWAKGRGMDVRKLKELCQKLDELAALLEIMEGEQISVDLHREASNALSQALSEIERLRSDVDQHRETSNALRDTLAEIERLPSDAADLHHTKFDRALSNPPPASTAGGTDWFTKFLERKRALFGEKVDGRKKRVE